MKNSKFALLIAAALAVGGGVSAYVVANAPAKAAAASEERIQTFAIENMTCATCPITVKKAMSGVDGVVSVNVDFGAKTATVVYDPSVTNSEWIAAASTNAGYPATAI